MTREQESALARLMRARTPAKVAEVVRWAWEKARIDLRDRGWWRQLELELDW